MHNQYPCTIYLILLHKQSFLNHFEDRKIPNQCFIAWFDIIVMFHPWIIVLFYHLMWNQKYIQIIMSMYCLLNMNTIHTNNLFQTFKNVLLWLDVCFLMMTRISHWSVGRNANVFDVIPNKQLNLPFILLIGSFESTKAKRCNREPMFRQSIASNCYNWNRLLTLDNVSFRC